MFVYYLTDSILHQLKRDSSTAVDTVTNVHTPDIVGEKIHVTYSH